MRSDSRAQTLAYTKICIVETFLSRIQDNGGPEQEAHVLKGPIISPMFMYPTQNINELFCGPPPLTSGFVVPRVH
jgi:hypothetical protein